jgi:RNA polymerase primary sigma factor
MTTTLVHSREALAEPGRNQYPCDEVLTRTQERLLIARLQRDSHDLDAQERIVLANVRYVSQIAATFTGRGIDLEDLQQLGCLAILHAARQFDLHSPYKLSTYATYKIRQAMQREIENHGSLIHIPSFQHQQVRARRKQQQSSDIETGQHVDKGGSFALEEVERALQQCISLDASIEQVHGEHSIGEILEDLQESTEETVLQTLLRADIEYVLTQVLTVREKRIVEMIYGLHESHPDYPYTLDEIGQREKMSRERARQIAKKAIEKLRASELACRMLGNGHVTPLPLKGPHQPPSVEHPQQPQQLHKRKRSLTRGRGRTQ